MEKLSHQSPEDLPEGVASLDAARARKVNKGINQHLVSLFGRQGETPEEILDRVLNRGFYDDETPDGPDIA